MPGSENYVRVGLRAAEYFTLLSNFHVIFVRWNGFYHLVIKVEIGEKMRVKAFEGDYNVHLKPVDKTSFIRMTHPSLIEIQKRASNSIFRGRLIRFQLTMPRPSVERGFLFSNRSTVFGRCGKCGFSLEVVPFVWSYFHNRAARFEFLESLDNNVW